MIRLFAILIILVVVISCRNSDSKKEMPFLPDTVKTISSSETARQPDKSAFQNVYEVITNKNPGGWTHIQDSGTSCILFFNSDSFGGDTLDIEYSPECWLSFPYKVSPKQITVYWAKIVDSKYNFDIVKCVKSIKNKYQGKPFIILELINDTALQATYPYPELIKKLNSVDRSSVLFPEKYFFLKASHLQK